MADADTPTCEAPPLGPKCGVTTIKGSVAGLKCSPDLRSAEREKEVSDIDDGSGEEDSSQNDVDESAWMRGAVDSAFIALLDEKLSDGRLMVNCKACDMKFPRKCWVKHAASKMHKALVEILSGDDTQHMEIRTKRRMIKCLLCSAGVVKGQSPRFRVSEWAAHLTSNEHVAAKSSSPVSPLRSAS